MGKQTGRLDKLEVKIRAVGFGNLTRSERRQARKLVAQEEGLGRRWRVPGYQEPGKGLRKGAKLRGRHAREAQRSRGGDWSQRSLERV